MVVSDNTEPSTQATEFEAPRLKNSVHTLSQYGEKNKRSPEKRHGDSGLTYWSCTPCDGWHKIGDTGRVRPRNLLGVSRTRYRLRHTTRTAVPKQTNVSENEEMRTTNRFFNPSNSLAKRFTSERREGRLGKGTKGREEIGSDCQKQLCDRFIDWEARGPRSKGTEKTAGASFGTAGQARKHNRTSYRQRLRCERVCAEAACTGD
ncbi:hypothetical protein Bbelb_197430 [Branchiostoma belcheri]|nr:hypothetical protein Bbelb_197430 [Branchiostoma belcheri]